MLLNPVLVYLLVIVAVEVVCLVLLYIFSTKEEWLEEQHNGKGCYDWGNLCNLPKETMALFVSRSTTQKWSNEYAIVVIFQRNRAITTRIIDMSYLQYDVKNIIRKYDKDFLHMSLSANDEATAVKIDSEPIPDGDRVASVISTLLQNDVKTDLHKRPAYGVRILYLTMHSY